MLKQQKMFIDIYLRPKIPHMRSQEKNKVFINIFTSKEKYKISMKVSIFLMYLYIHVCVNNKMGHMALLQIINEKHYKT